MNYIRLSIVNYNNSFKILYYYVGMLVFVLSPSASLPFSRGGTFRDDTITGWARREFVSHAAALSCYALLLLVAWRHKMAVIKSDWLAILFVGDLLWMQNISLQLKWNPFSLGLPWIPSDCRSFPKSIICSQSEGRDIIFHLNEKKKNLRKR